MTYQTSDLLEIVYLRCKGVPISGIHREASNSERVIFSFPDEEVCRPLVMELSTGNDLVSLSQAKSMEKRIRTLMRTV